MFVQRYVQCRAKLILHRMKISGLSELPFQHNGNPVGDFKVGGNGKPLNRLIYNFPVGRLSMAQLG